LAACSIDAMTTPQNNINLHESPRPDASGEPSAPAAGPGDAHPPEAARRLQRVLGLGDLLFYGIVLIQPVGAVGLFGVASQMSRGHMLPAILLAMVAMMLTAVSYGRMSVLYPSAGSGYTYVGQGLNPHLGFLTGWALVLDYLICPVVNVIYGALSAQRLLPSVPYGAWVLILGLGMTLLNARGIRWTARANQLLLAVMCAVIAVFVVAAARYLFRAGGAGGLFSWLPFYDPRTFDRHAVLTATSFAALTYIGFDGITTLAEDARQPKRTVPLATVLVCLITGLAAGVQVYLAQRVAPDYRQFHDVETAFMDVAGRVGGPWLFQAVAAMMAVACLGSGLTAQVGAARLLYSMGRDNVLPRRLFGRLDRRGAPTVNVWLIGAAALGGAFLLNYERAAELINFGAFLAFMGVNAAAIRVFWFRRQPGHRRRWLADVAVPGLGLLVCLWIWCSLPEPAQVIGGIWFALGVLYAAIRTRGFRRRPVMLDFSDRDPQ
jgi:amino acid transporter